MSMTDGILTALPAPDGYQVNFEDPPQIGDVAGYFVTAFGIALAATFLGMRLYTRCFITRNFGLEDLAVALSFFFGLGTQAILLHLWAIKASGVHAWEMPFERFQGQNADLWGSEYNLAFYTVIIMVASILYVPCLGFAKLSILLLYHRLSKLTWFNIAVRIVMGIVISYSLGIICALIFPCTPIAMNWDLSITEGECIDKAGIYLATAAVNVITDFMILLLPIPVVMSLQMKRLQKFGVIGLFFLGSLTFITSIVRLVYMVPMVSQVDQTRVVSIPTVWINVEANLVVITTSLPSLRSFLRHVFPSVFDESSYAPRKNSGYHTGKSGTSAASKLGTSRSRYGRMDSSSRGTIDVEMAAVDNRMHGEHTHALHFGSHGSTEVRGNTSDVGPDDGSEKAIWQTRTVTVEYGK